MDLAKEYPDVETTHMYVDNCAMINKKTNTA